MSRRRRPKGPVSVHVHRAGQREAERAKFIGVNHLRRLGAFAGPVEEVDGALLARPVVRCLDGQIVKSDQIDVAQLRDGPALVYPKRRKKVLMNNQIIYDHC